MTSLQTVTTKGGKKPLMILLAVIISVLLSAVVYSQVSQTCPIAAYEGELVNLSVEAYDPDPEIGPAGALILTFGPPFNSKGMWQTLKGQRGIFNFWASVSDGDLKSTNHSCVEVLPNNRNPVLQPVSDIYITRGANTQISATCTDPDGDPVEITYRFNGKDVSFILYEPPGTYNLDVICTDGFGGVDTEKAKLHIDMPVPVQKPKPAHVIVAQPKPPTQPKQTEIELVMPKAQEKQLSKPDVIEVHYPKQTGPDVIEVRYPSVCSPCSTNNTVSRPVENIDVVIYSTAVQPIADTNTTAHFVLESNTTPQPAPSQDVVIDTCAENLKRKNAITTAMGCC